MGERGGGVGVKIWPLCPDPSWVVRWLLPRARLRGLCGWEGDSSPGIGGSAISKHCGVTRDLSQRVLFQHKFPRGGPPGSLVAGRGFTNSYLWSPSARLISELPDDTLGDNAATSTHRALHGHVNRVKPMSGPGRAGTRLGGADIGSYVCVTLTARCETLGSHIRTPIYAPPASVAHFSCKFVPSAAKLTCRLPAGKFY